MAELEDITARKERLRRAFEDLDKERDVLNRFVFQWKDLEELFADVERRVRSRYEDLIDREQEFQKYVSELQEQLAERELQLQRREEELAAAEVNNTRSNMIRLVKPKLEQDSVSKHEQQQESSMDLDLNLAQPCSSEGAEDEEKVVYDIRAMINEEPETTTTTATPAASLNEKRRVEVSGVRPELKALCESMDGDGLRRFIVEHRKEVGVLREELSGALRYASDAGRMVLAALEAYHPEAGGHVVRKETEASASRRACILLLECLQVVFADPVLGVDHPVVPPDVKELAREVADKWRSKMDIQRDGSYLDAQAFLQLLATFAIAAEYDEDELCKLISAISRRKQTPALCRAIGLEAKIPDIVNRLVDEGKQIEALSFANEFGIMDQIQPALLLRNYLKEAQKVAQTMLKSGHKSAAAQNDSMMKELSALRSVLKCIEEYKLEADYPSSPIQKRISSLEKAKQDRKRTGGSVKGQAKRPRGSNNNHNFNSNNNNNNNGYSYRNSERNSDRGQYSSNVSGGYQFVSPVAFERQNQGGYMPSYPGRNTVSMSTLPPASYMYPTPDGSLYGAGYTTNSTSYPSYATLRNTLPPPPPAYQASFMH